LYLKIEGVDSYEEFLTRVKEKSDINYNRHLIHRPNDITPGKMKCEKIIQEAIFLRPKCYAIYGHEPGKSEDKEDTRVKGLIKSQNKDLLTFEQYKKTW
jgi:hypothetical protein